MIDYHIHLETGPYTLEWLDKYWQQAKKRGLNEIGITEHAHQFKEFKPVYEHLWQDPKQEPVIRDWLSKNFQYSLEEYFQLLKEGESAGIPLKVGLEADYFPSSENLIRTLLQQYHFDFVLGSIHFIDYWSFDYDPQLGWPERDVDEVYRSYLSLMEKMVQSNLFDVLAHLDVIKVFGNRNKKSLEIEWNALLHSISQADLSIEVSTAGLRKLVGEIYPHHTILRQAATLGIPITIASDAHTPSDVGDRWEKAVLYAQELGYTQYSSFTKRNRRMHELPLL